MKPLTDEQSRLVADNLAVAENAAKRYCARHPGARDAYRDIERAARRGLMDAATRYEPERGAKFGTFAYRRCYYAIIDALREGSRRDMSRRAIRNHRTTEQARDDFYKQHGRYPTPAEMRELVGDNGCVMPRVHFAIQHTGVDGDSQPHTRGKELIDEHDHEAEVDADDAFDAMVSKLPSRKHRTAIIMYYRGGFTQAEIAKVLGYSQARASQIRLESLAILKSSMAGYSPN